MATPQYRLLQADTQDAPESNYTTLYAKTDGLLYYHPYGGSETEVGGGEGLPDYSGASDGHTLQISGGAPVWSAPSAALPPGMIVAYGGTSAPSGWLLCDGSAVSRTTYADLYAAIGNAHGSGDGSTTFHLPDLRGRFLRGVDSGAGRDPDAASRTASATGGNAGDAVGSKQGDATAANGLSTASNGSHTHSGSTNTTGAHSHTVPRSASGGAGTARYILGTSYGAIDTSTNGDHSHSLSINSNGNHTHSLSGDNETRPLNVGVHYIIKT